MSMHSGESTHQWQWQWQMDNANWFCLLNRILLYELLSGQRLYENIPVNSLILQVSQGRRLDIEKLAAPTALKVRQLPIPVKVRRLLSSLRPLGCKATLL